MSVSIPSPVGDAYKQLSGSGSRGGISLSPPVGRLPGDLLIAVIGSGRAVDTVSTGWTLIAPSTGSGTSYVAGYWKIADGTETGDSVSFTFAATTSWAIGMVAVRSTVGFDTASIESYSRNVTTAAGASYALSSGLTGVGTGELSVALGGNHGSTTYSNNYCNVSGTAWTLVGQGGPLADGGSSVGGCMVAQCPTTGTPAVPSVTYTQTAPTFNKFIFAAVVKDGTASPVVAGLFFGAP